MSQEDLALPTDICALQRLLQQQRTAVAEQQEQLAQQAELIAQQQFCEANLSADALRARRTDSNNGCTRRSKP